MEKGLLCLVEFEVTWRVCVEGDHKGLMAV